MSPSHAAGNPEALAVMVEAMSRGEQAALRSLFDATVARVHAVAVRITGSDDAADDVVSEVYYKAWNEAVRYDPERASVARWLLHIARTTSLDALRRLNRVRESPGDEPLTEDAMQATGVMDMLDSRSRMHDAFTSLDTVERQLVELAFLCGYSHSEIAHLAGMPLGTVKTRIRRALKLLRAYAD